MSVLAICSDRLCNTVFWSQAVILGQNTTATFEGGRIVSGCPKCKSDGIIPDGEYSPATITLFRNDQWLDIASSLNLVVSYMKEGDSRDVAIDKAAHKPWVADYLKGFVPRNLKDLADCTRIMSWAAVVATAAYHGEKIASVPNAVAEILNGIKTQAIEHDESRSDIRNSSPKPLDQGKELRSKSAPAASTQDPTQERIRPTEPDTTPSLE